MCGLMAILNRHPNCRKIRVSKLILYIATEFVTIRLIITSNYLVFNQCSLWVDKQSECIIIFEYEFKNIEAYKC